MDHDAKKTKISESYKPSEYYKRCGTTLITLTVCHNKKVNGKKNWHAVRKTTEEKTIFILTFSVDCFYFFLWWDVDADMIDILECNFILILF